MQQETNKMASARQRFLHLCVHKCAGARFAAASLLVLFCLFAKIEGGMTQASAPAQSVQYGRDTGALPPEVKRMRQAILEAAASGEVERLRTPIEMNEIHPVFSKARTPDPIAYLKSKSADGNGREMLAILFNIMTAGYAIKNAGTQDEMFIWPAHALLPLNALTPSQEVEIYRFLPPARVKEMAANGKYSFYSVGIGRDGVWHYFTAD